LVSLLGQVVADPVRTTQKPAVILVPAAFSKATVYDQVKGILSDQGYCVIPVNLPSVGKLAAKVDRTRDIKVVQEALRQQIQKGKDVILVGNSYGGTVICDVVGEFESKSSVKFTGRGKILGLIFVSLTSPRYFLSINVEEEVVVVTC
jgi:dienelactone hydrolase